jgi:hypothetical protein
MDGVPIAAALLAGACAAFPERLLALLEVESDRISLLP